MVSLLRPALLPSVRFAAAMMLLCGLAYPLVTAGLGRLLFPYAATGSIVWLEGRAVGSDLIAQPFTAEGYLHGRPSACDHDPRALAGSNLAASNPALRARVAADVAAVAAREGISAASVPPDLVAASASCVDPHITPEAAHLQIPRIARVRGLTVSEVTQIIAHATAGEGALTLGPPRVHVLAVNLALDARAPDDAR